MRTDGDYSIGIGLKRPAREDAKIIITPRLHKHFQVCMHIFASISKFACTSSQDGIHILFTKFPLR